jgi:hypothetical protein
LLENNHQSTSPLLYKPAVTYDATIPPASATPYSTEIPAQPHSSSTYYSFCKARRTGKV